MEPSIDTQGGVRLKPLFCDHCMTKWKKDSKPLEKKPKPIYLKDLDNGCCPVCHNVWRTYFPF